MESLNFVLSVLLSTFGIILLIVLIILGIRLIQVLNKFDSVIDDISENDIVDVFSITGKLVKKQIRRGDAIPQLTNGVYIIGRQKVVVTGN